MASSWVQSVLGKNMEWYAAAGAVAISYVAFKLAYSILSGLKCFVLAKPLGLSVDLKKTGAWAVVTGCTDGIGKAYTEQLAQKGMDIVLISRTESKLLTLAGDIESRFGVKTKIIVADFSQGATIYPGIRKGLEGIDIGVLINNVGLGYEFPAYLHEVPDRDQKFIDLIEVNITSVTMMTSIVMPQMVAKKKGVIVNLSSASGMKPTPLLGVYAAAKAYVDYFSVCMQKEYESKGIIVQSVMPNFVTTKMSKIRKASLMVPNPDTFVSSALSLIGVSNRTNGYWSHNLLGYLTNSLPLWFTSMVSFKILNTARVRAFKKLAQQKKE
ncbi:very-long-chain 3-oxoacyl-CoA reductase-like [Mizuhopecten yessoensis]|uniref:Estradiol 17-beta-dehydrogenase 12 n=1 Tax=Mizuhopecten yessoensis TaxID=6573 RepID=A0A210QED1_MIZYE|nr:very-long-chain 3-oxoacyl-CoA reductase-like [Mizuhopecten yessoensis]OWF47110.1 Estradiol 17-beta-dehydrogenase 12 [Mizuhopecten yessoensis]